MDFLKTTGRFLKGTAKATGDAANGVRKFAEKHQDKIARATSVGVSVAGRATRVAGKTISGAAHMGADGVINKLPKSGVAADLAVLVTASLEKLVDLTGRGVEIVGNTTARVAPIAGKAAGSVVTGGVTVMSGAVDSIAISESDIEQLRQEAVSCGEWAKQRSDRKLKAIEFAQQRHRKDELLDLLVIGGVTLADMVRAPGQVPREIEKAFHLQYPNLHETFIHAVNRMSSDQLVGLVSGVKGKLFELELVDHLNHGALPAGWHADLADSANQPAWDIKITDAHGHVADLAQAKATQSVEYVVDALKHHPDIDVTTTSEVYSHLVALGFANHVHDGGVTDAALNVKVEAAAHATAGGFGAHDFIPSSIGLAVIGLSVFLDKSMTAEERGEAFGHRSGQASVAGAAAKAAMIATQTWWAGLVVGMGSRWLSSHGQNKRARYETLSDAIKAIRSLERGDGNSSDRFIPQV